MKTIKIITILSSLLTLPLLHTMDLDPKNEIITKQPHKSLSQKQWICKSPYENDDCNNCRGKTCINICVIGTGICATFKTEDWCCESFCTYNSYPECKEICSSSKCKDLWFPLGEEYCKVSDMDCLPAIRWITTIGILISPVIGLFSFSPCCNENGLFCCLKQINKKTHNDNSASCESIEMINNNN